MQKTTLKKWSETSAPTLEERFAKAMSRWSGSFAERETAAMELANEMVRRWMESELNRMADRYGDHVLVDGQRYRRHSVGTVRYHTLVGTVAVERYTYRQVGVHNGPTVVPLEIEAGLEANATPALALSAVQGFAMMPLRQYEDEMRAAHRIPPSRSTLERVAKHVSSTVQRRLVVIEPVLRAEEPLPPSAASISVGIDRTTIPMAEELPPGTAPRRLDYKRRPPPPIVVAYRMGYVATIAVNDARGEALVSKRIAATADEGPDEMMERLGSELEWLREQRPTLPIVIVQDGAPELWNLVEEWLSSWRFPIELKLIDRYHVSERLSQIAELLERDERRRHKLLNRWRQSLDTSDSAIRKICKDIERRVWAPIPASRWSEPIGIDWPLEKPLKVSRTTERIVEGHLGYYKRYADKIAYATPRARGFPIGSGVTEGACKSVIAARLKRSGQRWYPHGAAACLQVRTLYLNGRLPRALALHHEFRLREFSSSAAS